MRIKHDSGHAFLDVNGVIICTETKCSVSLDGRQLTLEVDRFNQRVILREISPITGHPLGVDLYSGRDWILVGRSNKLVNDLG